MDSDFLSVCFEKTALISDKKSAFLKWNIVCKMADNKMSNKKSNDMNTVKKHNGTWFPSFLDEVLRPDFMGGVQHFQQFHPAVNIREDETQFFIDVAVPGMKKEDIRIEVEKNILTISAEEKTRNEEINERFTRKEFSFGSFKRAFTLPKTVSDEQIGAHYAHGILHLTLPKRAEALPKPKRTIEIGG